MARTLVPLFLVCACRTGPAAPPPDHAGHSAEVSVHHHDHAHPHQHHGPREGMQHSFADVASYARTFDNSERDAWQKPAEVVALLALAPGASVADLGAGTGYFLGALSSAVGPAGHVLALDSEPNMVAYLSERMTREKLANAAARLVQPEDPELAPASLDRILVVNTWHHLSDRVGYAAKLARALRPGGVLAVVDFTAESDLGPPPEHRLSALEVVGELRQAGFTASVAEESLPKQYVVLGRVP